MIRCPHHIAQHLAIEHCIACVREERDRLREQAGWLEAGVRGLARESRDRAVRSRAAARNAILPVTETKASTAATRDEWFADLLDDFLASSPKPQSMEEELYRARRSEAALIERVRSVLRERAAWIEQNANLQQAGDAFREMAEYLPLALLGTPSLEQSTISNPRIFGGAPVLGRGIKASQVLAALAESEGPYMVALRLGVDSALIERMLLDLSALLNHPLSDPSVDPERGGND